MKMDFCNTLMRLYLNLMDKWFILLFLYLQTTGTDSGGYCTFPKFLWEALPDGSSRKWISKTEYVDNTDTWERQKDIGVKPTEITIKLKFHANCNGYDDMGSVPCYRRNMLYEIICISEEPNNKFRVLQKVDEKKSFTCLKFVPRAQNIVQVYSAVPREINEDRLCYDEALQREEWPWVAVLLPEKWLNCPFTGGFDFVAFRGDHKEKMCASEWRPSRLESECIKGEGLTFYYPHQDCSPFYQHPEEQKLHCWTSWKEESFVYVILAEEKKLPRYVLRMPANAVERKSFVSFFYFSLVLPFSGRGNPPGRVLFHELHVTRSEPGVCYDESEYCTDHARDGKCTNSALHEFANFCMKSCGLCDYVPSARPECRFPEKSLGRWVVFNSVGKEDILIRGGNFTSSALGTFICKGKHWNYDFYKVLSVFNNGCRPRYSCLHLVEVASNLFQYKLSRSHRIDTSFKMCDFTDATHNMRETIDNRIVKNMFLKHQLQYKTCGLGGILHVNVTFANRVSCDGTISDVDPVTCSTQPIATVDLHSCSYGPRIEYSCIAFAVLTTGTSFLVTRSSTESNPTGGYLCWVVKGDAGRKTMKPWRETYQFDRADCGTGKIIQPPLNSWEVSVILTHADQIEKPCGHTRDDGSFLKIISSKSTSVPESSTLWENRARGESSIVRTTSSKSHTRKHEYRKISHSESGASGTSTQLNISPAYSYLWSALLCIYIYLVNSIIVPIPT